MKRILIALASAGLLAVVACGGGKTCDDAANAYNACLKTFGLPPQTTVAAECSAAVCPDKQKAIDCVANTQCGATAIVYDVAIEACFAGCQ